MAVQFMCQTAT